MNDADLPLRRRVEAILAEDGLVTQIAPIPEDNVAFDALVAELRALDANDLRGKLVVGGFIDHPYGEDKLSCMSCMYYLANRKWCDLPELALPVRPGWWCRLWRL